MKSFVVMGTAAQPAFYALGVMVNPYSPEEMKELLLQLIEEQVLTGFPDEEQDGYTMDEVDFAGLMSGRYQRFEFSLNVAGTEVPLVIQSVGVYEA